jgi:hypothetical protein
VLLCAALNHLKEVKDRHPCGAQREERNEERFLATRRRRPGAPLCEKQNSFIEFHASECGVRLLKECARGVVQGPTLRNIVIARIEMHGGEHFPFS